MVSPNGESRQMLEHNGRGDDQPTYCADLATSAATPGTSASSAETACRGDSTPAVLGFDFGSSKRPEPLSSLLPDSPLTPSGRSAARRAQPPRVIHKGSAN